MQAAPVTLDRSAATTPACTHAMPYYPDLSEIEYGGVRGLAVGWLAAEQPYATGTVSSETFGALVRLLQHPWQPAATAGIHLCPFCRFTGGPSTVDYGGVRAVMRSAVLVVPSPQCLYVAPSLIAHYVDAHGYAPPNDFGAAVSSCPEMRSISYLRSLRKHGVSRR
jgi:hypothetical protein